MKVFYSSMLRVYVDIRFDRNEGHESHPSLHRTAERIPAPLGAENFSSYVVYMAGLELPRALLDHLFK